jgi:hypothetical protein
LTGKTQALFRNSKGITLLEVSLALTAGPDEDFVHLMTLEWKDWLGIFYFLVNTEFLVLETIC